MIRQTLGGYKSINSFVDGKLASYEKTDKDFGALFEMMFSEKENIIYEKSEGYRIVKTTYGQAYGDVIKLSSSAASAFSGIPADSVIGLYMENSLLWIELFWALLRAGYRPLLLNLRVDGERLEYAIKESGAAAVISDGKKFSVRTVSSSDIQSAPAAECGAKFGSAVLIMSSGTSAHIKLCSYSAKEFYFMVSGSLNIIKKCKIAKKHYKGELKQLTFLPFYHIFGLVAMYIWFAFFSRTFVQLNDLSPETLVNTVKRHNVTHIFAVPLFWETVYKTALKTIKARGEQTYEKFERGMKIADKLSSCPPLYRLFTKAAFKEVRENLFGESISFMITGGSRIGSDVLRFFNNIGYHLANGYGMSEIGITSVELSSDPRILNSGSVGKPLDGITYSVSDKGTLLVSGRCMAEYVVEDGEKHERPDVFDTKDLVEFKNGRYFITGRADDLIAGPSGENINPGPAEEKLLISGVRGVCLIGAPSERGTEPVLIVSVGKYAGAEELEAYENKLKEKLGELDLRSQVTKIVFISDELIQGTEFKLNRRRILNEYADGKLHTVTKDRAGTDVGDDAVMIFIRDCFAAALGKPAEKISAGSDLFADEGGSSLDYFAIIAQIQREFGVSFPQGAGAGLSTVASLAAYVKEQMKNADKTV
ncbi:MAG: non-ribosomal peptide synthetase [Clostridia bacterium]|nr:non-ribosomal peptide synthetase [Clostridia bacterium]